MKFFTGNFNYKFSKTALSHALMLASMSSVVPLSACQSTATQNTIQHLTNHPTALSPSQNAHNLMTDMMIHRFDKAYDFEKVTQYQAFALYPENDIEKNDQSLWFSLLKNYVDKQKFKDKKDEISPEEQKCLDILETGNKKNLTQLMEKQITEKTYEKQSEKTNALYNKCLDKLPKPIKAQIQDRQDQFGSEHPPAIATVSDSSTPLDTDSDSVDKEKLDTQRPLSASKYQIMAQAMIDKLNTMDNDTEKSQKTKALDSDGEDMPDSDDDIVTLFKNLKLTPQQIQVLNDSYLKPHLTSYKGSYNPTKNQFSTVYEESLQRPFVDTYRRVPVLVDFNEMSITAEPDMVLPLLGVISLVSDSSKQPVDDNTFGKLAGKSVKFTLPDRLKQKIPLNLLKETLIKAVGKSYADLPAERFSEVALDEYAKTLHASRAVKLNLTHQDIGYLIGRSMKYWANELNSLSTQHPEYLTNRDDFKVSLDLLNALNRHYRSDDLAKIAQIIEAILPLSYNGYNYYYFDSQNNLVGYRKNTDYSSSLFGARMTSTTTAKLTYHGGKADAHTFYHPKPEQVIDGNALVREYKTEKKLQDEAKSARWGYATENESSDEPTQYSEDSAEAAVRSADLSKNLKLIGKKDCQNFYIKHKTVLTSALDYRKDDDFATEYPVLQRFFDTCPAQVNKLEASQIKWQQTHTTAEPATESAANAAELATTRVAENKSLQKK